VHLGLWTDWSRGRVLGQTLTLSRKDGNLLTAFTASFVVFVGARVWSMTSLFLHRYYSTPEDRDALHHQRQVLLRNTSSADDATLSFIQLFWAWRGSAVRCLRRLAPVLVLSIICTVGFTLAGGYSSQIQIGDNNVGSDVLLSGTNCAIASPNVSTLEDAMAYDRLISKWIADSVNYVQQCYSSNSSGLADCNYFVTQTLPAYVNTTANCPFEDSICKNASTNIVLDTGLLNSHEHFGINAPHDERILIRSVLECAPLVTENFTLSDGNFTAYEYGPLLVPSSVGNPINYTYEAYDVEWQYKTMNDHQGVFSGTQNSTPALDPGSGFTPINQLARTDADLTIVFLSGYGVFAGTPIYDPWYQSTVPFTNISSQGKTGIEQVYRLDNAASPLGCASQWQFCNADSSACGPLASYDDAVSSAASEVFGDTDAANRFAWFTNSLNLLTNMLQGMLEAAQVNALLAAQSVDDGYQESLPDNQWQLEVTNWFAISLAFMQQAIVETASGSAAQEAELVSEKPTSAATTAMCRNQKIRTTRYASFSFFGIMFVYVLGVVLIALSFSLEPILASLYRRRGYRQYSFAEWNSHGTLQLQRLAHDDGDDEWAGCMEQIPV
ncbi:hypothetical protein M406DRAFT_227270, partial [Cryphonectria parasitica EP155]